jgi:hypothetical protein
LKQYPGAYFGQNNLAVCYAALHNMPRAMEESRRAVHLAPKDLMACIYFPDEPSNAEDFALKLIEAGRRHTLIAKKIAPQLDGMERGVTGS